MDQAKDVRDTHAKIVFELKTQDRKTIQLDFEEVEFLVESTRISFSSIWPDEAFTEEQLSNPQFKRQMTLEFVNKFIPELTKRFNQEFGMVFTQGSVNRVFTKMREYQLQLKKNSVEETSSVSSTASTAVNSLTTSTTTSSAT